MLDFVCFSLVHSTSGLAANFRASKILEHCTVYAKQLVPLELEGAELPLCKVAV